MSTQQDIYAAGSENRPSMLNKDNYVPWSSRIIRYVRSTPNGKMIIDSLENGPCVRRMIATPEEPDLPVLEKKAKLFNEWEKFTSTDGESIESYYHRFMQLMNDLKRNKHFSENIAANLKFINNLQPELKRHVTIVRQTKNLHEADFTQIYDFLKMNQDENFMQPPMTSLEDINDPTEAMNAALILFAKALQLTNFRENGGNQFRQYAGQVAQNQQGYNAWQNGGIQVAQNAVQNAGVHSCGNQNRLVVVPGIANQNGTGNIVGARAEGSGYGNQARCYNCIGLGHIARNSTARPRRRDTAYLQTQLLIAQKEEAHASTSGTRLDKAPEEQYTDLLEPIPEPQLVPQNDNHVTSVVLIDQVAQVNMVNCNMRATNAELKSELARYKIQEQRIEISQEKYDKLEKCYQKSVYQEQCLNRKINALHLSSVKQITTLNNEISNLNKQLSKEKTSIFSLMEEKKRLKHDFKTREDKYLDKEVDLEAKIKDLENILLKRDQTVQTMHMLNPKPDSFYHPDQKMALGYPNPSYLKKAKLKQQSLYNGHLLLEEHDPPAVYDSEETLEIAQEWVFVSQTTKSKEELFFSNVSNMSIVSKTTSIPNEDLSDDTTPGIARKFLNEVKNSLATLQRVVKQKMTLEVHNWSSFAHTKVERLQAQLRDLNGESSDTPSASNTLDPLNQKLETKIVKLEFQVVNYERKISHLKTTYKNLFDSITSSRAHAKIHNLIYENAKLRARLFENTSEFMNNTSGMSVTPQVNKPKLIVVTPYSKKLHASILSHSVPQPREFNVVKHSNVIAPGMFKIDPSQTFRVDMENVSSDTVNASSTGVYFVEGLSHNLFSVGQFCDADLEVAFRRNTYFIRDLDGVDLLKGNRSTNLYTINLYDMASASPICLMACATPTKSWLWHQRLSYLNFDTINDLAKNDLVFGLPKFKYAKEHLCPSYDYSQYTWVHFLRTKDETPKVIKNLLKKIFVHLQASVIILRTDNGTEFKNHALKEYFDSVGITHETYAATTPQQNGVVERRNRTLVEAARTMLIFSHAPLFLWAEAIATAVYNQRTKKIIETTNVTFDELSMMAFEQNSSKPGLQSLTSGQLELTYAPSTITPQRPSERDLDILFEPLHNEYLGGRPSEAPRTIPAAPVLQNLQAPTASMSIQDSALAQTNSSNTPVSSHNGDLFVNHFATPSTESVVSSTHYVDPSNMHTFYQPYPHDYQWTKDHPLEQVIGEPSRPVLTRSQLKTDGDMCIYALTISIMEPKSVKEALTDHAWIESTQEELHQFIRLDVWELVPSPDGIKPLTLKWLFKNKHDEENTIIRNKTRLVDVLGIRYTQRIHSVSNGCENCISAWFIEGRRQSPRAWYDELSTFLLQNEFSKGTIDPTLFTRRFDDDILVVQVYVDDIILGSTNPRYATLFSDLMKSRFEMSMMGEMTFFVGLQVNQSHSGIFINQSNYMNEILKKYGLNTCDIIGTPMDIKDKLDLDQIETLVDATKYRSMIGALMYLTSSKPDIVHATCDSGFKLTGFSDADYTRCKDNFKNTSGGAQFLGEKIMSWSLKKQDCTSLSTAES
nr:hypothetical protein [Tanacetum cinerariifolium]